MPLAYREARAPRAGYGTTFANWFGCVYHDEKELLPSFSIDAENYREIYTSSCAADQWQAVRPQAGAVWVIPA